VLLVEVFSGNISTFVKHHSTVEKYMSNRNPKWMVLRDRWEGLNGADTNYITHVKHTGSVKCI
jgi:hypothetical protein